MTKPAENPQTPPARNVTEIRRQPTMTQDLVPMLDTGKFEHMQRIASSMAVSSLVPQHLRDPDPRVTIANCFRVVNQAVRWNMDPFAVIDETYVVRGKLGYQGKLIAGIVNSKAGLKERLRYKYNDKSGNDLELTVIGTFLGEDEPREVTVRVGAVRTDNKMWEQDPRQKLIYTGATKWARAYCPELLLGVLTVEDIERMAAERAIDITPPIISAPMSQLEQFEQAMGGKAAPQPATTIEQPPQPEQNPASEPSPKPAGGGADGPPAAGAATTSPEPPSPLKDRKAVWGPRVAWLRQKLASLDPAARADFILTDPDMRHLESTAHWAGLERYMDELKVAEKKA